MDLFPYNLLPQISDFSLNSQWLLLFVVLAVSTSAMLWSGKIRQPGIVNFLSTALILPSINLTMIIAGILLFSDQLQHALVALLPF